MRRKSSERPFRRVRKPKRRHLEQADLEDTFDTPELEDWMIGSAAK